MNPPAEAVSAPQSEPSPRARKPTRPAQTRDRSRLAVLWYQCVRGLAGIVFTTLYGLRATGRRNVTAEGGALLVCNHLSHLDVFVIGVPLLRPLNYVARSTLFLPVLGFLIRSVGGFAIQREGMGAQGLKETLRRVRSGGIVALFPEGTRSPDGELAALKPGIAVLAARTGVPIIPAALAGTFEAWPREQRLPHPHRIRIHYGRPIEPETIAGLDPATVTALIRDRILESQAIARRALARDMA
jgi:1-acyl-sn-glycerol-3-phosphate acyltransferase